MKRKIIMLEYEWLEFITNIPDDKGAKMIKAIYDHVRGLPTDYITDIALKAYLDTYIFPVLDEKGKGVR